MLKEYGFFIENMLNNINFVVSIPKQTCIFVNTLKRIIMYDRDLEPEEEELEDGFVDWWVDLPKKY